MRRQLKPAVLMVVVFTVLCGIVYPLSMTAVASIGFASNGEGSFIERDGEVIGSELIGQEFTSPEYFWGRPSATAYSPEFGPSAGSNEGPTSEALLTAVAERVAAYREAHDLADDVDVPVDAVTASGSGLDPHISIANARLQAKRVADERSMLHDDVLTLIDDVARRGSVPFIDAPTVNVVLLNLALGEGTA